MVLRGARAGELLSQLLRLIAHDPNGFARVWSEG